MRSMLKLLAVFVLMMTVLLPQAAASAGGGSGGGGTFQIRSRGASALFQSTDGSGCIVTVVQVFASEDVYKSPSEPRSGQPTAFVSILQQDVCQDTTLMLASGSTAVSGSELQVSKKLDSAALSTTVTLTDQLSDTTFDVFVDVSWASTGSLRRDKVHQRFHAPDCNFNFVVHGLFQPAEASGSVSDGVTEFAPNPATTSSIFFTRVGSVTIGCEP